VSLEMGIYRLHHAVLFCQQPAKDDVGLELENLERQVYITVLTFLSNCLIPNRIASSAHRIYLEHTEKIHALARYIAYCPIPPRKSQPIYAFFLQLFCFLLFVFSLLANFFYTSSDT
jgi:hypothetical protein